jgi:vacuolar-type H+-ATPase subunit I/STV1
MASPRTLAWVERLVWILIYGGLLALVLGLATRAAKPVFGWSMIAGGALIAAVGVVLIWVRSRLRQAP